MTAVEERPGGPSEALTTQPAEPETRRPAGRRTPLGSLLFAWRRLTSMRTALQLLFLLSLAAIPGGLLPQRGQEAGRVDAYLQTHRTLGPILDRLSLFDVFAAPWFAAIYLLLFVSLVGCLLPRIRLHARALRRRPPATPARLERLPGGYATFTTDRSGDEVLTAARPLLRGWRVAAFETSLSAERGYARETGNLVFHVSLVVLLAGIALGSVFGYEGDRVLADGPSSLSGTTFANTRIAYDQFRPGRLLNASGLPDWTLHLDDFVASYRADGSPADYVAHTTFTPAGGTARPVDIKVNHPLSAGSGTEVYLLNHGYAPVFTLTSASGAVQTSQPVICAPISAATLLSRCVVSFSGLPRDPKTGAAADLAFDIVLAPTGGIDATRGFFSSSPTLGAPVLSVTSYVGDLGQPSDLEHLDYRLLKPVAGVPVAMILRDPGKRTVTDLPGGYTLGVADIRDWASFQVKRDPAKKLVLLAAVGIVGGLLLSLRVRRRRLWIRVREEPQPPDPDGNAGETRRTLVEVGGLARSDADACRRELDEIAHALEAAPPS